MGAVLKSIRVGPHMLSLILSLYTNPSASVHVNNALTNAFPIRNGTRQGCPLCPILFVFTLAPFLRSIRLNPSIQGIQANRDFKLAAFADDILLFLSKPLTTILLAEFQHFCLLSNLKIMFSKSFALNISLPQHQVDHCKDDFAFHWKPDSITYLGIQLPFKLSNLNMKSTVFFA